MFLLDAFYKRRNKIGETKRRRENEQAVFFNMVLFMFVTILVLLLLDDAGRMFIGNHIYAVLLIVFLFMAIRAVASGFKKNQTSWSLYALFGAGGLTLMTPFAPFLAIFVPFLGIIGMGGLFSSAGGFFSDLLADLSAPS